MFIFFFLLFGIVNLSSTGDDEARGIISKTLQIESKIKAQRRLDEAWELLDQLATSEEPVPRKLEKLMRLQKKINHHILSVSDTSFLVHLHAAAFLIGCQIDKYSNERKDEEASECEDIVVKKLILKKIKSSTGAEFSEQQNVQPPKVAIALSVLSEAIKTSANSLESDENEKKCLQEALLATKLIFKIFLKA